MTLKTTLIIILIIPIIIVFLKGGYFAFKNSALIKIEMMENGFYGFKDFIFISPPYLLNYILFLKKNKITISDLIKKAIKVYFIHPVLIFPYVVIVSSLFNKILLIILKLFS